MVLSSNLVYSREGVLWVGCFSLLNLNIGSMSMSKERTSLSYCLRSVSSVTGSQVSIRKRGVFLALQTYEFMWMRFLITILFKLYFLPPPGFVVWLFTPLDFVIFIDITEFWFGNKLCSEKTTFFLICFGCIPYSNISPWWDIKVPLISNTTLMTDKSWLLWCYLSVAQGSAGSDPYKWLHYLVTYDLEQFKNSRPGHVRNSPSITNGSTQIVQNTTSSAHGVISLSLRKSVKMLCLWKEPLAPQTSAKANWVSTWEKHVTSILKSSFHCLPVLLSHSQRVSECSVAQQAKKKKIHLNSSFNSPR